MRTNTLAALEPCSSRQAKNSPHGQHKKLQHRTASLVLANHLSSTKTATARRN